MRGEGQRQKVLGLLYQPESEIGLQLGEQNWRYRSHQLTHGLLGGFN